MKLNKSYKYRIKPNEKQKDAIQTIFNNCELVRRMFLEDSTMGISYSQLKEALKRYKEKYPYLNNTDTLALMNVLFKSNDEYQKGLINSKKRAKQSYSTAYLRYADSFKFVDREHIYLPKVGNVKIIYHRPLPINCQIREATIIKEADKKYYVCIALEIIISNNEVKLNKNKSIGLDYSSAHFLVDSNGKFYDAPHFYREKIDTLRKLRKELDKCEMESNNYYKKLKQINKVHQKIVRKRKDYLHKLSTNIVNQYDYICIEDLNILALSKRSTLKTATKDNSYGEFIKMLNYKAKVNGKKVIKINRYFPSTKTCNKCGSICNDVTIDIKEWKCPECGEIHDRDINAAKNIKEEGLRLCAADWSVNVR